MNEKIVGALVSSNPKKQIRALEELNHVANSSPKDVLFALPQVIPLIGSSNPNVSSLALAFTAMVSSKDPRQILNAVPLAMNILGKTIQLGGGAATMFSQCANALVILGDAGLANPNAIKPAIPFITKVIMPPIYKPETFNEDAKVLYTNAISALAKVGSKQPLYLKDSVVHLARVLADTYKYALLKKDGNEKGGIRWWTILAIHEVGSLNPALVVPAMIKIMTEKDKELQTNAEKAIMRFFQVHPDKTIPAEISTLSDSDEKVRKASIYILQKQIDKSPKVVLPYLKKGIESDNKQRRQICIQLIGKTGGISPNLVKDAIPVLTKATISKDKEIKQAAIEALGLIGARNADLIRDSIPYIVEALKDPIGNTRWCAVTAFEKIANNNPNMLKGVLPNIYRCLQDPAEHVRWRAQELFQKLHLDPKRYPIIMSDISRLAETLREARKTQADTTELENGIKNARKALDNFDMATAEKIINDTMKIANELNVKASSKASSKSVESKLDSSNIASLKFPTNDTSVSNETNTLKSSGDSSPLKDEDNGLMDLYRFDNFVVGPSNSLAHAAALAVSKTPSRSYNPLFIYSQPGLGKTHLLQAIGNKIVKSNPEKKVVYVTSEKLINDLISATEGDWLNEFRRKYRNIDVLLVDDIHFLAGKERMQEEFFHTFNSLYNSNKQIVLTSDRPPKEIATLEERLRSRFEWGFVVDIQPPTFETRLAIVRKKMENKHQDISYEVLSFIATYITNNIRELDGALNKIMAYSTLTGKKVNLPLAKEVLKGMLPEEAFTEEEVSAGAAKVEESASKEVYAEDAPVTTTNISPPVSNTEEEPDDDFEPEWGVTYISKEARPDKAYKFFNELVKNGAEGLIITRIHPDKARKKYEIPDSVPIYWLSKAPGEFCRTPTNIGKLAFTISEYSKEHVGRVILLDGLEYIISNNDFPMILRWLDDVHEGIVLNNSLFIVPTTPDTYTTKELTLLERSAKVLTDNELEHAAAFVRYLRELEKTEESEAPLNFPSEEEYPKEEPKDTQIPPEPEVPDDNRAAKLEATEASSSESSPVEKQSPQQMEAMTSIKLASTKISFARASGADVSEAEKLLEEAKNIYNNGQWNTTIKKAQEAVALTEKAMDDVFKTM